MIEVNAFSKSYDGVVAVDTLSFRVAPREVLGMVGPNGAGKTTTLRAICGILPPTSGTLSVGGHDIVKNGVAAKRLLAYLPDEPRLFDNLTVWEHLRFAASIYRVNDYETRARALLDRLQLEPHRDKPAEQLSRGLRQRTALACAYLHEPAAILYDEPLVGLDPYGIRTLKESIREQAARGAAVIVSSHMLSLIEDVCNRLLILHKGRAVFSGTLDEARAQMTNGSGRLEDFFFQMTESA